MPAEMSYLMKYLPDLSLEDLRIADVNVYGMSREEAVGVPEMGASTGTYGCCTTCCSDGYCQPGLPGVGGS